MFLPAINAYYTAFAGSFSCTFFRVTSEKACTSLTSLTSLLPADDQQRSTKEATKRCMAVLSFCDWSRGLELGKCIRPLAVPCFTNERNISQSRPTLLSKCQELSRCQNDEKRLQILSRRYLFRLDKSTSKLQRNVSKRHKMKLGHSLPIPDPKTISTRSTSFQFSSKNYLFRLEASQAHLSRPIPCQLRAEDDGERHPSA